MAAMTTKTSTSAATTTNCGNDRMGYPRYCPLHLLEDVLHGHDNGVLPRQHAVVHPAVAPRPNAVTALVNDLGGGVNHVVVFKHELLKPTQLVKQHR